MLAAVVTLTGVLALGDQPPMNRPQLLNPTRVWFGELAAPLPADRKGVITDANEWQRFWKDAKLPGRCPEVDFQTHLVVTTQHLGWSRVLAGMLHVEADGTARTDWLSNPDRIFGSYGIAAFPRRGLKSVNGQALWP